MALRDLARPPLLCVVSMVLVLPYALILRGFGLVTTSADTMAIAAVLVAAMLGSIVGFGFAPLCAAMLLPLMGDPVQVVTILLLGSIAIQSLSVWTLRRSIDWHALLPFLAGGVLGLPIGVCLLLHLHRDDYVRLLGGLLVLYGACSVETLAWLGTLGGYLGMSGPEVVDADAFEVGAAGGR
ncbi:TSUP family transporter [Siccirubricoccus deserti]